MFWLRGVGSKWQLTRLRLWGLTWWALDFPFVARHVPVEIEQRTELAGRDIDALKPLKRWRAGFFRCPRGTDAARQRTGAWLTPPVAGATVGPAYLQDPDAQHAPHLR